MKDSLIKKNNIIKGLKNIIAYLFINKGVPKKNKNKNKETVVPSFERDVNKASIRLFTHFSTFLPNDNNYNINSRNYLIK